jgi:hypothetical protein
VVTWYNAVIGIFAPLLGFVPEYLRFDRVAVRRQASRYADWPGRVTTISTVVPSAMYVSMKWWPAPEGKVYGLLGQRGIEGVVAEVASRL